LLARAGTAGARPTTGLTLNLTNTATFAGPNTALGSPGFGSITEQANYPRLLQLSFRAFW